MEKTSVLWPIHNKVYTPQRKFAELPVYFVNVFVKAFHLLCAHIWATFPESAIFFFFTLFFFGENFSNRTRFKALTNT